MAGIRFLKFTLAAYAMLPVCGLGQQAQAPAPHIITDHASDAYAIYSLLLSKQQSRNGQPIAIAETTIPAEDIQTEPDHELQPPSDSENGFHAAVQDFQAHRQEQVQLQHQLKLDRPYTLLTQDEVDTFRKNPAATQPNQARYSSVVLLSEVYFNPAGTAALVYIDKACATPCGSGQWLYLAKRDGQWIRRSSSMFDRASTYAIYSLLMPGVPFAGMSSTQAPHFAIAGTTVNIEDMNPAIPPDGQLQPPPDNGDAFREAVQDFYTRKYERMQIEDQLQLDRPYTLLSAGDVAELRSTLAGIDPGSQLQDKWAGYPGITYFSEVYFNTAHTAALVYMNNFCANLCANGQWIYLEKKNSQWVRRSGLNI
jgi:hypothetical protein